MDSETESLVLAVADGKISGDRALEILSDAASQLSDRASALGASLANCESQIANLAQRKADDA